MRKLWLTAAMVASVAAMQLPAAAAPVTGIPAPHGVHGIVYHPCRWHHRYYRRCPHQPLGIVVGRKPVGVVGRKPIGVVTHPIGIETHGVPVDGVQTHGIPAEPHVQH